MAAIPRQRISAQQSSLGIQEAGVWPIQALRRAVADGLITAGQYSIPAQSFQPASLDLRLGEKAYRLRSSFLPGDASVRDKLSEYTIGPDLDLRDGAILEIGRPYLIPLIEQLRLPSGIRGRTNPKSSTGRLDVFTRVISNHSHKFDEIAPGYRGGLFLEVVSRTFTVFVKTGLSLNQIRLVEGDNPSVTEQQLQDTHHATPLLYSETGAVYPELAAGNGIFLSIDLTDQGEGRVGYRAKRNSKLLDMTKLAAYEARDFWDDVIPEGKGKVILEPEEFYLLVSREQVSIPPKFAAEMTAFDPTSGEIRTHYAGFFDPGFGYSKQGKPVGSRAVLEVRAHDVPFMLEHGQTICKLEFSWMLEPPEVLYGDDPKSSYQGQGLALSKHFVRPKYKRGPTLI